MKRLCAIVVFVLLAMNLGCGGGGGSSSHSSGATNVTITLGNIRAADLNGKLFSEASSIPPEVASVRFEISAPDMATIERTVSVSGQNSLSESFTVPNGSNRHFVVDARDAAGHVNYTGDSFADLNGTAVTLPITMVAQDTVPPVFSGLSDITSIATTSLTLVWPPATDNVTPQTELQYLVYMAAVQGGENFSSPSYITTPGQTSFTVTGLNQNTTYYFVVRAKDERGNIDTNTVERSATTLSVSSGALSGRVNNALTNAPLQGVSITVYNQNTVVASGVTIEDGSYSFPVPAGSGYRIEFMKEGFITAVYESVAVGTGTTTLEPVLQIDTGHSGAGSLSGTIVDAFSGQGVDAVTINLRAGINVTSGPIAATGITQDRGFFNFTDLAAGNYTAEALKSGYTNGYFTVICIGGTSTGNQQGTITPIIESGQTRIILSWGEEPSDLDSHLTGPTPESSRFHIFYAQETYAVNDVVYADLDLDDTDSFGPETTTIYQQISGVYRFSVHDYSNRDSLDSTALSKSGAQVKVYRGDALVAAFNVPVNQGGTLWTVFELDGTTITPINALSYEADSYNIQSQPVKRVIEDDSMLLKNLPLKR
jgi:Carboxypeptidase regulatory-like domain/Fibronectin type III domain